MCCVHLKGRTVLCSSVLPLSKSSLIYVRLILVLVLTNLVCFSGQCRWRQNCSSQRLGFQRSRRPDCERAEPVLASNGAANQPRAPFLCSMRSKQERLISHFFFILRLTWRDIVDPTEDSTFSTLLAPFPASLPPLLSIPLLLLLLLLLLCLVLSKARIWCACCGPSWYICCGALLLPR